ncbi:MAG TPA: hypothetical protein VIT23_08040, partial [Terrimicrobiaceae bacterium]
IVFPLEGVAQGIITIITANVTRNKKFVVPLKLMHPMKFPNDDSNLIFAGTLFRHTHHDYEIRSGSNAHDRGRQLGHAPS